MDTDTAGLAPRVTRSVIILGAGIFGASTALWLSRNRPHWRITLIDQAPYPCPRAASFDINKIVRVGYADWDYCRLAARNQEVWRTDPLYKPFYHEDGMISIMPYGGGARQIIQNLEKLGIDAGASILSRDDVRQRFNGVFKDSNFGDAQELLYDSTSAWAEADKALTETINAAIENGVSYTAAAVSRLYIEGDRCTGVITESGQCLQASQVLLSTGADTARVLADSAPNRPELHAGRRFVAAAITVAKVKLTLTQKEKYANIPAVLWDAAPAHGEAMPATDGYLKFIRDIPLANTIHHPASDTQISVPPTSSSLTEWTTPDSIPKALRDEMSTVIRGILGPAAAHELIPESMRLCWDALAPDENFFITPHPRCENLFVATGGTGHAWKFLPTIGEHVGRMLDDAEKWKAEELVYAQRWSWDRDIEDSPDDDIIPRRNLADLIGDEEMEAEISQQEGRSGWSCQVA